MHVNLNSIYIKTISKHIYPLFLFLKKHTSSQYKSLVDIVCYDRIGKRQRFSLIYNLLSSDLNYRLKIIIKLKEKLPVVSTVVPLYSSAGWLEREVWDLFGIFFIDNLDLRRILTDYGFIGYPLRKDFPLSGFVEAIYVDTEKQVLYKPLDLSQDFRNYRFKNAWKC